MAGNVPQGLAALVKGLPEGKAAMTAFRSSSPLTHQFLRVC